MNAQLTSRFVLALAAVMLTLAMYAAPTSRGESATFDEDPTSNVISVQSGSWSDPATWNPGVPSTTDDVTIQSGHIITFDVGSTEINSLTIQAEAVLQSRSGTVKGSNTFSQIADSITITTLSDIVIYGVVQSGSGGDANSQYVNRSVAMPDTLWNSKELFASIQRKALATSSAGGDAGDVVLISQFGDIALADSAQILLGDGGDGGDATAVGANGLPGSGSSNGANGEDAEAHGGVGGRGGSLRLECGLGNLVLPEIPGIVTRLWQ